MTTRHTCPSYARAYSPPWTLPHPSLAKGCLFYTCGERAKCKRIQTYTHVHVFRIDMAQPDRDREADPRERGVLSMGTGAAATEEAEAEEWKRKMSSAEERFAPSAFSSAFWNSALSF